MNLQDKEYVNSDILEKYKIFIFYDFKKYFDKQNTNKIFLNDM